MSGINRTLLTNEILKEKIGVLKDIITCLEEIVEQPEKGGVSAISICFNHGVSWLNLRNLINCKTFNKIYIDENKIVHTEEINLDETPQEKLYRSIFNYHGRYEIQYPLDLNETLEYALEHTNLTERERECIDLYFGLHDYPKTLNEIGEIFSVLSGRIGQILAKAYRKLRRPPMDKILRDGLMEYNNNKTLEELERNKRMNEFLNRVEKIKKEIEDAKTNTEDIEFKEEKDESVDKKELYKHIDSLSMSDKTDICFEICEYCDNITVEEVLRNADRRTYNCIYRASLQNKSLMDIVKIEDKFLLDRVRNFGEKSLEELNRACDKYLEPFEMTRYKLKKLFNKVFPDEVSYTKFVIASKAKNIIVKGENLINGVDRVSESIKLSDFADPNDISILKPVYCNTIYIKSILKHSPLYYNMINNYKCENDEIKNVAIKVCNDFLSYFNITHEEYLKRKNIIYIEENKDEFYKENDHIAQMAKKAVYNNMIVHENTIKSLPQYIEDENALEVLVTKIVKMIYNWSYSYYTYDCCWETEILGEPEEHFNEEIVDPMTIYLFVIDYLQERYNTLLLIQR